MDGEPYRSQAKKLTDAARYWARGGESLKDAIDDLKRMNAPEEALIELIEMQASEDFEVWPENWIAVEIFLRVQTQWRATYGTYYGLDYNSLFAVLDLYEIAERKDIFEQVQLIERSIIAALNEEQ